ncbi:hypothetical protein SRHO_G00182570 [Serrasalmus rhombeus]
MRDQLGSTTPPLKLNSLQRQTRASRPGPATGDPRSQSQAQSAGGRRPDGQNSQLERPSATLNANEHGEKFPRDFGDVFGEQPVNREYIVFSQKA